MKMNNKRNKDIPDAPRHEEADASVDVNNEVPVDSSPGDPPIAEGSASDEVDVLRARMAGLEDQMLRAVAEQQNIRKRSANELTEAVRYAKAGLIRSLLDVLDDLERALGQESAGESTALLEGVRLVYDNFTKVLRDHDVVSIEALGRRFDPALHEAMMQQPTRDHEPGTVIQVLQGGYRMHERVLRPAKVIIAAASQTADGQGAGAGESDNVDKHSRE